MHSRQPWDKLMVHGTIAVLLHLVECIFVQPRDLLLEISMNASYSALALKLKGL